MTQKVKGTYDVYGLYGKKLLYVENIIRNLMEKYGYDYFRLPTFEYSDIFHRGVGETTDIVSKETYTFLDRGGRSLTLRPEGTAGVVRSFIENKFNNTAATPLKTWYYGQMFRYERPQSGRFREFYQFGIEVFKSDSPIVDAEVISIAVNLYKILGLKGIKVNINTLGDSESRKNYNDALIKYLEKHFDSLSEDSKVRFEKNPLRILDSKDETDQKIVAEAPKMTDYLNENSKEHYEKVKEYLDLLEIEYSENPKLVRGLDYYTHTVFEVEADIKGFGAQNVLCGGGRYDGLVETLGGPSVPGVGFAMGMERLLTALDYEEIKLVDESNIDVYIAPLSENEIPYSFKLTSFLRLNGFNTEFDYMNRNIKNNFKNAEKLGAKYIVLIGNDEITSNELTIKNTETKEEFKVNADYIVSFLDEKLEDLHE